MALGGGPGARLAVLGGARASFQPQTSAGGVQATAQAYANTGTGDEGPALAPIHGFGIRFWMGVAGIALLWAVYYSLPE